MRPWGANWARAFANDKFPVWNPAQPHRKATTRRYVGICCRVVRASEKVNIEGDAWWSKILARVDVATEEV